MQLNLWMGRLLRQALPVIEREKPDILCLQEVFSCPDHVVKYPDKLFNGVELIRDLGFAFTYFSPVCVFRIDEASAAYGNAILSRLPIKKSETIDVNGGIAQGTLKPLPTSNHRNAQYASIEYASGKFLSLLNHHAYWEPDGMGSQTNVEKMQRVRDFAAEKPHPLILCGDLNVIPASPAMRVWDNMLEDLTASYQVATTLSSLSKANQKGFIGDTNVACDHILVSPGIQVRDFRVLPDIISDHLGLVLDFDIDDNPAKK